MSPITFRKAQRSNLGLLLSLAGGTGSGKTYSALALAKGIADGKRFAICDTERGRASFYADDFDFDVFELNPPFSPDRYLAVIKAAEAKGYPVLVIDSMSHEWEGEGGLIEWHDELMGGQESKNLSAWIKPKMAHRKMVNHLVQAKPHIILCFRAAERVEVGKDEKGRTTIVPKRTLTGLDGWVPITEKNLPFEAAASFLLIASAPGVPHPIKLPEPLKPLVPLDRPLTVEVGAALAAWASGGRSTEALTDVTLESLLDARAEADPSAEWLRETLRSVGLATVPENVTLATIKRLTEDQGLRLLSELNALVDANTNGPEDRAPGRSTIGGARDAVDAG
ncbi:MAG: AAA family ATPase [Solirubrobacteraceae bacterium]